jgi:hypothetical protein
MNKDRLLSRDVVVTQIPSGDKHTLFAGAKVFIHQVLGGTYTVQGDAGLYRLDAERVKFALAAYLRARLGKGRRREATPRAARRRGPQR